MRKNKMEGKIPNAGRKKELENPVNVSFMVEREKLIAVRKQHGHGLNGILRKFFNNL